MAYSQQDSAAAIYECLAGVRDNFLRRAEECAALTIPMLVPKNGEARVGTIAEFDTPRQGIGARGVNHLSSRLSLTLLPPASPFFKFKVDPFALDALTRTDDSTQANVAAILSQIEDSVHMVVNSEAMRVSAAEIFKHLVVSGNACMYLPKEGGMQYFPLSQYVVMRDPEGDECIEFILKECIHKQALPEDVLKIVEATEADDYFKSQEPQSGKAKSSPDDYVEIYTRQRRINKNKYEKWQELRSGVLIPETYGTYKPDNIMYRPLRWTKVQGEAYGRGLVEEYKGDLIILEGLSQALVEGALAAARVIGLIAPNAQTSPKDINDAANGEFIVGREEDVSFLELNKQADFRTVDGAAVRTEKRLEGAFLLNSSVIRDAERVTAEEVRFAAQELESTFGGVYSILAHEFQLPLVNSILGRLRKKGAIPSFPKELEDKIKPIIVTGVDALGRNAELERITAAVGILSQMIGPEAAAMVIKKPAMARYIFSQAGVTIKGLIMSEAEMMAAEKARQAAAMNQEALSKGIGPAINAVSKATTEGQQGE